MNIQLKIAEAIASDVRRVVQAQSRRRPLGIELGTRGQGGDIAKYGDQLVEKKVISSIQQVIKKGQATKIVLISEESGVQIFENKKRLKRSALELFVILDPIDGSNNMRPWHTPRCLVGLSMAIGRLKTVETAGTIDAVETAWISNIFYNTDYFATRKGGAFYSEPKRQPQRLHVSPLKKVRESIITSSIDKSGKRLDAIVARLLPLWREKKCQRRLGSTVLDLASVATGETDGFVSISGEVKVHDIAAAKLIIEEAGGIVNLKQVRGNFPTTYLKELILGQDNGLIQGIGFEVTAAGTKELLKKIRSLVK